MRANIDLQDKCEHRNATKYGPTDVEIIYNKITGAVDATFHVHHMRCPRCARLFSWAELQEEVRE